MDEVISQDFVHCMRDFLKENIHCIILYGSVARGDDIVESDIDLAVIVEKRLSKRKNYQI